MADIGSLVVSLKANTAQFTSGMESVRGGIEKTRGSFGGAERAVASFAARGIGAVVPAAEGMEHSIARMTEKALAAGGALRLVGQAAIVVGGVLAVAAIVQAAQDWIKYGETVSQVKERLEETTKAMREAVEAAQRWGALRRGLQQQLIQSHQELEQAVTLALGDELGAARAAFEGKLALIEIERKVREDSIQRTVGLGQQRDQALVVSNEIAINKIKLAHQEWDKALLAISEKEQAVQIKAWVDETKQYIDELKARLDARRAFESSLGQAAGLLGVEDSAAAGFRQVAALRSAFTRSTQDIAFLQQTGALSSQDALTERTKAIEGVIRKAGEIREKFGGISSVAAALDKTVNAIQFNAFSEELEKARGWAENLARAEGDATAAADALDEAIVAVATGATTAIPEIQNLARAVSGLRDNLNAAWRDALGLASALSASHAQDAANQPAGEPVEQGFQ